MDSTPPGINGPEPTAKQTVLRLRDRVIDAGPDDPDETLTHADRNAIIEFGEQFSADRKKRPLGVAPPPEQAPGYYRLR